MGFQEGEDLKFTPCYDYNKDDMDIDHFQRMREHKLEKLQQYNIKIFFDDNPFYVEWMRNRGITVFQLILPDAYLNKFGLDDPFFCCHLQEKQFHFLSLLSNREVIKHP